MSVNTLSAGADHFGTVRHLRLGGTQREIGRALAAAAEQAHGTAAAPVPAHDPLVEQARRRWFALNHPVLAERMRGVADHFGLAADDCSVSLDWLGTYDCPGRVLGRLLSGGGDQGRARRPGPELRLSHGHLQPDRRSAWSAGRATTGG